MSPELAEFMAFVDDALHGDRDAVHNLANELSRGRTPLVAEALYRSLGRAEWRRRG